MNSGSVWEEKLLLENQNVSHEFYDFLFINPLPMLLSSSGNRIFISAIFFGIKYDLYIIGFFYVKVKLTSFNNQIHI